MNWKQEAMEKLRRYDVMQAATQNIPQELLRLRIDAQSVRAAQTDRPAVKGGENRTEQALINNLIHRQELQRVYRKAKLWVDITDRALGALLPEEKLILHSLYIQPSRGAVEQLCQRLEVEKSSVYRKRDKALERFAMALYGTPES